MVHWDSFDFEQWKEVKALQLNHLWSLCWAERENQTKGMYLNMCLHFFLKVGLQTGYSEWVIVISFALYKQSLKKSILILFPWHGDFVPEF